MATVDLTQGSVHTDPLLGFTIDKRDRKIILSFVIASFIIIALGAIAAFFIGYTRSPSIMLLKPQGYYMALTFHGVLMLTMFPHLFEIGLAFYCATALLKQRLYSTRMAWTGFWLCIVGISIILITIALGDSSVMYTMYVPLRAAGMFYLGHFIYAIGLLVEVIVFSLTILAWKGNNPGKSLPLVTYGAGVIMILLLIALLSAVVAFLPTTMWAFRILIFWVDPMVFKMAFWGMGHTLQYVNIIGLVIAWYMISVYAHHSKPASEKWSRMAFALYTLTTLPVFGHHLIVDPTFSPAYKYFGATMVGMFLGIPSMMHGFAVPGSIEATLRRRQRAEGKPVKRWTFVRHWGWHNPAMIMLAFSVVLFGVGGFDGTISTTVPLSMILHNTMYIPAHFHGTLAAGMAVAYMGLSYYFIPALGIDIVGRGWAKFQAWITPIGFLLLIASMHWGAELGVPRRTQSIWYTHAGAATPQWFTAMNTIVIGTTLAVTGVLIFTTIMIVSVIKSRPTADRKPLQNGLWGEPWVKETSAKVATTA